MSTKDHAVVSQPGDGYVVEAFGTNLLRINGSRTHGSVSVMEVVFPNGAGTPLHMHEREDELFRVLSGRFGFWCGDEYTELGQDGLIYLPRNVPHRVQNIGSSEGRVMVTLTPGGFEEFFVAVAEGGDPLAAAERFGLVFLMTSGA